MKKVVAIVLIVLFFLFLLAAIAYKLFAPASTNSVDAPNVQYPEAVDATGSTSQNPSDFVMSFYRWYLQNVSQNDYFPYTDDLSVVFKPWLTSEFIASWDQQVSLSDGYDPALLVTDNRAALGTNIHASVISQSVREALIYVTIGSSNQHKYQVTVIRSSTDGMWKISSINVTS